jgi:hypothetical protein
MVPPNNELALILDPNGSFYPNWTPFGISTLEFECM